MGRGRMRSVVLALFAIGALLGGAGGARAAEAGAVFVVQHVDVAPATAQRAAKSLRQARMLGRKEPGNLWFETFAEAGRPSRFVIASAWQDQAAADAHGASAGAKQLHDALEPLRVTPVDQRVLTLLAGDPAAGRPGRAKPGPGAVYVVTHMDSIPPFKDEAAAALQRLSQASEVEPGVLRYEVLQQA